MTRRRHKWAACGAVAVGALALLAWAVAGPARAAPLIADLSKHLVAITTGFAGTDVLLFGAIEDPGDGHAGNFRHSIPRRTGSQAVRPRVQD